MEELHALQVLAYLPGEYNFYVVDDKSQMCIWTLRGLLPVPGHFLQSAIDKHGYRDLRSLGISVLPNQIKELTEHLDSLD